MTHRLKIVTLNTWNCQGRFSHRLAMMAHGLRSIAPDVVLLQEVFAQAPRGMNVAKRMAEELDLHFAFLPARRKLRKLNNAPILCDSGLAVLSRWPIASTIEIKLPEDARDGERLAQLVYLNEGPYSLAIANVHLSHLKDADQLREKQLHKVVGAINDSAVLTVVGGDMNVALGCAAAPKLSGFRVPDGLIDIKGTLSPVNGQSVSDAVIDHIYLRPHSDVTIDAQAYVSLDQPDARTGHFASDHKAIVVDVTIDTPKKIRELS